ncbi:hypothetical protein SAMN05216603_101254 [Pseudomonas benzenivorans]|nr:hypothetical protein [Pseudomonas benzenivorans]SDG31766.1 hypothetical protein SAMN05216603_101254 [Pseudomonas benzenivorans]
MPAFKSLSLLALGATLLTACSSQAPDEPLEGDVSTSQITVEGVPGGVSTVVEKISAVVTAIDYDKRSFTLEDEAGHRRAVQAGPEMINFPQLKVGDKVYATIALEQLVFLGEPGEATQHGAAGLLATAPAGAKPGMLLADTLEVTAVVKAFDTAQHTATLEFADGSHKTVAVRPDVQLKPEYLGRQVVIRLSTALAIRVEAQ